MRSFLLTRAAQDDIDQIVDHLSQQSADAALVVLDEIESALGLIGENPHIGRPRRDLSPSGQLRSWVVFNYLILYRPNKPVEVVRIIHGAQDLPRAVRKKHR